MHVLYFFLKKKKKYIYLFYNNISNVTLSKTVDVSKIKLDFPRDLNEFIHFKYPFESRAYSIVLELMKFAVDESFNMFLNFVLILKLNERCH